MNVRYREDWLLFVAARAALIDDFRRCDFYADVALDEGVKERARVFTHAKEELWLAMDSPVPPKVADILSE